MAQSSCRQPLRRGFHAPPGPRPCSPPSACYLRSAAAESTTRSCSSARPTAASSSPTSPPGAKTERVVAGQRPGPAAERQRAIDVKAEANLVSERIQRSHRQPAPRRRRSATHAPGLPPARARSSRDDRRARRHQLRLRRRLRLPDALPASRHPGPRIGDTGIMDPTGTRGEGHRGAPRQDLTDQDRTEIVDVGERRARSREIAEAGEERRRRRCGRDDRGRSSPVPRPRQGVGRHEGAGVALDAVDAVGVGRQRPDFGSPCSARRSRAGTRWRGRRGRPSLHGHRRLAAREHDAGPANGWPRRATWRASAACTLPTSRDSPSISSPRMCASMPAARAARGGGIERLLRRRDEMHRVAGERRIARLRRLQRAALEAGADRRRHGDRVAVEDAPAHRRRSSGRAPSGRCR